MIINFEHESTVLNISDDIPFAEFKCKKGAILNYETIKHNYIVFVVSGEAKVKGRKNTDFLPMKSSNMYALSKLCSPYQFKALEDYKCVILQADSLANHVNATHLVEILQSDLEECNGVPSLQYDVVIESFVQNVLMLITCRESMTTDIFNIKKVEFLHYMRKLYSEPELTQFMYGILSTYSDFKMGVYSNFTNSSNVEQLAESVFMTVKTFTRRFKQEFNMTPLEWIVEQRLYNLNNAIVNKGMPLSSLLEEFGFASNSALRQFCKRYGADHLLEFMKDNKAI